MIQNIRLKTEEGSYANELDFQCGSKWTWTINVQIAFIDILLKVLPSIIISDFNSLDNLFNYYGSVLIHFSGPETR